MASAPLTRLTEEQYLEIERAAEFKSEFYAGEMFAMSGGTTSHARLQRNVLVEVTNRLPQTCEAFGSDLRVKAVATGLYTYPDVSIICGSAIYADKRKDTITNPTVLVEVLSPSTEAYDRGRKFQHYQTIPSLKEYLLVSQTEMRVERFTRAGDDSWMLRSYTGKDAALPIEAVGIVVPLEAIYQRVEFEETSEARQPL
jgi:Uma2 family endonuclease